MTDQPAPPPKSDRAVYAIMILVGWIASAVIFCWGIWMVAASVIDWMRFGTWQHPTIREVWMGLGFNAPALSWVGVNNVLQWFMGLPGSIAVIMVAFWIACWANEAANNPDYQLPR